MKLKISLIYLLLIIFIIPQPAHAMHIMEGFLPLHWCIIWGLLSIPFIILGIISIKKTIQTNPRFKMLLVFAASFTFVLSALKIPSVTGSCSHPTGVGLGAILFGPTTMTVASSIVLLFQTLLLAHGGLTTLGANIFSMGIVGPFVAYWIYKLVMKIKAKQWLAIFLAATLGNLMTYVTTSLQLALAFPAEHGGFMFSFAKFLTVFAVTQMPLAISEGILTIVVFNVLMVSSHNELKALNIISEEG